MDSSSGDTAQKMLPVRLTSRLLEKLSQCSVMAPGRNRLLHSTACVSARVVCFGEPLICYRSTSVSSSGDAALAGSTLSDICRREVAGGEFVAAAALARLGHAASLVTALPKVCLILILHSRVEKSATSHFHSCCFCYWFLCSQAWAS